MSFHITPERSAAVIATLVTLLFAFFAFALPLSMNFVPDWRIISIGILVFWMFSYLVVQGIIASFIFSRIRKIYRIIQPLEKTNPNQNILSNPSIEIVTSEKYAMEWAENRKSEMDRMRDNEIYRKEFLGNVSHELKTPIFNIQGYIHSLLDGGLDDPEVNRVFLMKADRSIQRMIAIVNDLETVSRLESGHLELDFDFIDLSALIKDVMESMERKATENFIKIKFAKKYDRIVQIRADRHRLRQVISNLIDNSIKYGRKGGTTEIRVHDMDETVLVEIADDGVGMDEVHLPRIFERFYRVDQSRSRQQGGSGLGLSIVKHIIEAHKQQVNVSSKAGEGTLFSFTLDKR